MGAQRGAHRIPSEFLIKIIYTFASFFITLFFYYTFAACRPKRFAKGGGWYWTRTNDLYDVNVTL